MTDSARTMQAVENAVRRLADVAAWSDPLPAGEFELCIDPVTSSPILAVIAIDGDRVNVTVRLPSDADDAGEDPNP